MRRIGWSVVGLVAGAVTGAFFFTRRARRTAARARAASPFEPAVALADEALESGNAASLEEKLGTKDGVLEDRFRRVVETRPHASESVAKGRAYTAAYVDLVNTVDRLRGESAERVH